MAFDRIFQGAEKQVWQHVFYVEIRTWNLQSQSLPASEEGGGGEGGGLYFSLFSSFHTEPQSALFRWLCK